MCPREAITRKPDTEGASPRLSGEMDSVCFNSSSDTWPLYAHFQTEDTFCVVSRGADTFLSSTLMTTRSTKESLRLDVE